MLSKQVCLKSLLLKVPHWPLAMWFARWTLMPRHQLQLLQLPQLLLPLLPPLRQHHNKPMPVDIHHLLLPKS